MVFTGTAFTCHEMISEASSVFLQSVQIVTGGAATESHSYCRGLN